MRNDSDALASCLGLIAALVVAIVLGAILNGYALSTMWGWFVLPVFESAPRLNVPQAIGIGMIVSYLTYQETSTESNKNKSIGEVIMMLLFRVTFKPLFSLFLAWIIVQFM